MGECSVHRQLERPLPRFGTVSLYQSLSASGERVIDQRIRDEIKRQWAQNRKIRRRGCSGWFIFSSVGKEERRPVKVRSLVVKNSSGWFSLSLASSRPSRAYRLTFLCPPVCPESRWLYSTWPFWVLILSHGVIWSLRVKPWRIVTSNPLFSVCHRTRPLRSPSRCLERPRLHSRYRWDVGLSCFCQTHRSCAHGSHRLLVRVLHAHSLSLVLVCSRESLRPVPTVLDRLLSLLRNIRWAAQQYSNCKYISMFQFENLCPVTCHRHHSESIR